MNIATGGDDAASEDEEIPVLCDLDEAAAITETEDDEQLPPVPVTILTGV